MLRRAEKQLNLLGGFELIADRVHIRIPRRGSKLLALLALNRRPMRRVQVAGEFWGDNSGERALANLRATLWRMPEPARQIVEADDVQIALRPDVRIDVEEADRLIRDILHSPQLVYNDAASAALSLELLPAWDDDWIVFERERLRQLQIRALECLTRRFIDHGNTLDAAATGWAAVQWEPLRESSQRLLIEAHLASGNRSEAIRRYDAYCRILMDELGIAPSFDLATIGDGATPK